MRPPQITRARTAGARREAACIALIVVFVLALLGCSKKDETTSSSSGQVDDAGFMLEPASEIGPHAFTAPFTVDPGACDKQAFLDDLRSRPDAYREWARVLGITEAEIPSYVATLQPAVLNTDTKVTNHGLKDGRAYPRKSILASGTAVLVDETFIAKNFPPSDSVPSISTSSSTPPTTPGTSTPPSSTTPSTTPGTSTPGTSTPGTSTPGTSTPGTSMTPTTLPGGGFPVTRCKCGNPLLPVGVDVLPPHGTVPPGTAGTSTAPPQQSTTTSVITSTTRPATSSSSAPSSSTTPSTSIPPSSSSLPPSSSTPSTSIVTTTEPKPTIF